MVLEHSNFYLLSIIKFDISVYRKQKRGRIFSSNSLRVCLFYRKGEIISNRGVEFVLNCDDFIISDQIIIGYVSML